MQRRRVTYEGHETRVRVYPISVEAAPLRAAAAQPAVTASSQPTSSGGGGTRSCCCGSTGSSSTKNIPRGFLAYEVLLRNRPEWQGRVRFLAMLSPSRVELDEYRAYAEECVREADRINDAFGTALVAADRAAHEGRYDAVVAGLRPVRRAAREPGRTTG